MIFDFVEHIRSIRYRRWAMNRVGTRINQIFALQFVFGLTKNKTLKKVSGRVNRFRRLWIARVRDLVGSELWMPTKDKLSPYDPNFDPKKCCSAIRRCMFCRPTVANFCAKDGKPVQIRPCWRTHICPFCWANLASAQYVYVKHVINKLVKQHADLVAVCRIVREYVPAKGFDFRVGTDPTQAEEHAKTLHTALQKHKRWYTQLAASKALQRKTLGSLWRVVVIPDDAGWHVESRQFFVCRRGTKIPSVRARGCKTVLNRSICLNNARLQVLEDFYNLFGSFCQYPIELLTGYNQLVAAYLNAAHDLRLTSGTGTFCKTGRALMKYMREHVIHDKARRAARRTQRQACAGTETRVESDPCSSPVCV